MQSASTESTESSVDNKFPSSLMTKSIQRCFFHNIEMKGMRLVTNNMNSTRIKNEAHQHVINFCLLRHWVVHIY